MCVCAFISKQRVGEECSFSLSLYFLAVSPRLSPPCPQCETPSLVEVEEEQELISEAGKLMRGREGSRRGEKGGTGAQV